MGALAIIFAEAAGIDDQWNESLKGWNMRESRTVLKWMTEARVEDRRETLLTILTERFGLLPADLVSAIHESADLDRLRGWLLQAVRATTLADFRAAAGI